MGSTTRCVRISRDLRKSELTGVFVTTGVSECAVNTRRRPDDAAVLLVSPRRREANFARRNDGKPSSNIFSTSVRSRTYFPLPSYMIIIKKCYLLRKKSSSGTTIVVLY